MEVHSTYTQDADNDRVSVETIGDESNQLSTSSNKHEDVSRICSHCMKINFDRILAPGFVVGDSPVAALNYIYIKGQEHCNLCSLFRSAAQSFRSATEGIFVSSTKGIFVSSTEGIFVPATEDLLKKPVLSAYSPAYAFHLDINAPCLNVLRVSPGKPDRADYTYSPSILPTNSNDSPICGRSTSEGVDWAAIKGWLHYCDTHHISCGDSSHMEPLRVIDCTTQELVYLSDPSDKYITLSYVWGTSIESSESWMGSLDTIPTLIADTIRAVQSLGLRYLWVDRYCIPRDNEGEKHTLIQNMGRIYSNSKLTIIAACCKDPSWGLPGVASRRRKKQPSAKVGAYSFVCTDFKIQDEVKNSVWNTRGWTYQEALLSKRRLVFGKSQVYFQCLDMHCYEALAIDPGRVKMEPGREPDHFRFINRGEIIPRIFPKEGIGQSMLDIEYRIGEFYPKRVSYESDTLNAFNGILKAFETKFNIRNICGLPLPSMSSSEIAKSPLGDLLIALQWNFSPWDTERVEDVQRITEFPSWSWAGWRVYPPAQVSITPRGWQNLWGSTWSRNLLHDCRNVDVEFEDGNKLKWHDDRDHIINYGATRSRPRWLHFRTWTTTFTGILKGRTPFISAEAKLGGTYLQGMTVNDMNSVFKLGHTSREFNTISCHQDETLGLLGIVLGSDQCGLSIMVVSPKTEVDYYEFAGCYNLQWPSNKDGANLKTKSRRGVVHPLPFRNLDATIDNQSVSYGGIEFTLKHMKVG